MQVLVRNFAEQLRQRPHTSHSSADLSQTNIQGDSKLPKPLQESKDQQPYQQKQIDLNAFREAWQRKQDRQIIAQSQPESKMIDQAEKVVSNNSQPTNAQPRWDFEQNCWLPEAASLDEQTAVQATVSTDPSPNPLETHLRSMPKSHSASPSAPIATSPNPWEMLRDHFISLRERRLALEKSSAPKSQSSSKDS